VAGYAQKGGACTEWEKGKEGTGRQPGCRVRLIRRGSEEGSRPMEEDKDSLKGRGRGHVEVEKKEN